MIILSALEIKDDPTYKILPNNPYWHCIGFSFEGKQYDIAFRKWIVFQRLSGVLVENFEKIKT